MKAFILIFILLSNFVIITNASSQSEATKLTSDQKLLLQNGFTYIYDSYMKILEQYKKNRIKLPPGEQLTPMLNKLKIINAKLEKSVPPQDIPLYVNTLMKYYSKYAPYQETLMRCLKRRTYPVCRTHAITYAKRYKNKNYRELLGEYKKVGLDKHLLPEERPKVLRLIKRQRPVKTIP